MVYTKDDRARDEWNDLAWYQNATSRILHLERQNAELQARVTELYAIAETRLVNMYKAFDAKWRSEYIETFDTYRVTMMINAQVIAEELDHWLGNDHRKKAMAEKFGNLAVQKLEEIVNGKR
jgi:hypothetical protein